MSEPTALEPSATFFYHTLLPFWQGLGDWSRLLIVASLLGAVLGLSESLRYLFKFPAEATRKTLHILSGSLACLFPWIFHSQGPILALAGAMIALFLLARYFSLFRSLFGVDRRSGGDIYFIASVWILYVLTPDDRLFYFIPLLTLTIADALAALLGKTYQKFTYEVEQQFKSFEGSSVFLLATYLCVHIPLLVFSPMGRLETLLIPLELAILVTCLESICLHGTDNIIIPLSTYYILKHPLTSPEAILSRLGVLVCVMAFVLLAGKKLRFLSFSGSLVFSLAFYGLYAIHDYDWMVPAAIAFLFFGITYALLDLYQKRRSARVQAQVPSQREHKAYHVLPTFYVALVPMALALSQDIYLRLGLKFNFPVIHADLYPIFMASVAVQLTLALTTVLKKQSAFLFSKSILVSLLASLASTLVLAVPFLKMPLQQLLCLASCLVACMIYAFLSGKKGLPASFPWPWRAYTLSSGLALALVWGFYLF